MLNSNSRNKPQRTVLVINCDLLVMNSVNLIQDKTNNT